MCPLSWTHQYRHGDCQSRTSQESTTGSPSHRGTCFRSRPPPSRTPEPARPGWGHRRACSALRPGEDFLRHCRRTFAADAAAAACRVLLSVFPCSHFSLSPPGTFPVSRTSCAALVAARHTLRRSRAVCRCGPLLTRTHHALRHHVMCLSDTWLPSCSEFASSPCSSWAFTSPSCPSWVTASLSCSLRSS